VTVCSTLVTTHSENIKLVQVTQCVAQSAQSASQIFTFYHIISFISLQVLASQNWSASNT